MATLGSIEKPSVEEYLRRRKLYLIPLVYSAREDPDGYKKLIEKYWQQAQDHIRSLSSRLGKVSKVYHEAVALAGEGGMKLLEALNPHSLKLAQEAGQQGASLEALEDQDWLTEVMDWERCLMIGLLSPKALNLVSSQYQEATKRRYEAIAKRIDDSLGPEEAGLLFISENHQVQFPTDIQVFYVAPPALDEIHRWVRDRRRQEKPAGPPEEESAQKTD